LLIEELIEFLSPFFNVFTSHSFFFLSFQIFLFSPLKGVEVAVAHLAETLHRPNQQQQKGGRGGSDGDSGSGAGDGPSSPHLLDEQGKQRLWGGAAVEILALPRFGTRADSSHPLGEDTHPIANKANHRQEYPQQDQQQQQLDGSMSAWLQRCRLTISSRKFDVIVFPEVGMHLGTYLLAHSRLVPDIREPELIHGHRLYHDHHFHHQDRNDHHLHQDRNDHQLDRQQDRNDHHLDRQHDHEEDGYRDQQEYQTNDSDDIDDINDNGNGNGNGDDDEGQQSDESGVAVGWKMRQGGAQIIAWGHPVTSGLPAPSSSSSPPSLAPSFPFFSSIDGWITHDSALSGSWAHRAFEFPPTSSASFSSSFSSSSSLFSSSSFSSSSSLSTARSLLQRDFTEPLIFLPASSDREVRWPHTHGRSFAVKKKKKREKTQKEEESGEDLLEDEEEVAMVELLEVSATTGRPVAELSLEGKVKLWKKLGLPLFAPPTTTTTPTPTPTPTIAPDCTNTHDKNADNTHFDAYNPQDHDQRRRAKSSRVVALMQAPHKVV
jgi:hypothetical protein